jgi:hypothetical protein
MASVTSYTAAKSQAIADASVVSGHIDITTGHLILTTGGGTVIDAGVARPDAIIAAAVLVETNARITAVAAEASARNTAIASAVDVLVDDTGYISGLTGFTVATGWDTASARYRIIKIGTLEIVDLGFSVQRNGASIANSASSNIANVTIFSAIPAVILPSAQVGIAGPGSASGRMVSCVIRLDSTIALAALGGTADLVDNEVVSCHVVYFR